jgi:hypothetical protein
MGVVLPFVSKKDKVLRDQVRKQCLSCVEQIKRRAEVLKQYSDPFDNFLPPDEADKLQIVADKILDAIAILENQES